MKFLSFKDMYNTMKKDINQINEKEVYISQDYEEWLNKQHLDDMNKNNKE